jgi:hypothetical protein
MEILQLPWSQLNSGLSTPQPNGLNSVVAPVVFKITFRHRPRRKHSFLIVEACLRRNCIATFAARIHRKYRSSVVACVYVADVNQATHISFRNRCVATVVHVTV